MPLNSSHCTFNVDFSIQILDIFRFMSFKEGLRVYWVYWALASKRGGLQSKILSARLDGTSLIPL